MSKVMSKVMVSMVSSLGYAFALKRCDCFVLSEREGEREGEIKSFSIQKSRRRFLSTL